VPPTTGPVAGDSAVTLGRARTVVLADEGAESDSEVVESMVVDSTLPTTDVAYVPTVAGTLS
jgi:hypothetical protein